MARLRAKSGADQIGVTIGDFATTTVEGRFSVAYLVFNTIMNLTTQDEQILCFQNVARHLQPGGCFVIEVAVPDLQRLPPGETVRAFTVSPARAWLRRVRHRGSGLDLPSLLDRRRQARGVFGAVSLRVAAELDLMARLAGLSLRERWSGWKREPFTSDSRQHVSVWEKVLS